MLLENASEIVEKRMVCEFTGYSWLRVVLSVRVRRFGHFNMRHVWQGKLYASQNMNRPEGYAQLRERIDYSKINKKLATPRIVAVPIGERHA